MAVAPAAAAAGVSVGAEVVLLFIVPVLAGGFIAFEVSAVALPRENPLARLGAVLDEMSGRLEELARCCRAASELAAEAGAAPAADHREAASDHDIGPRGGSGARAGSPAGLTDRQEALLVAVTSRGGSVEAEPLAELAASFGLSGEEVDALFAGPEPYLTRRAAGVSGLTERGLEVAAASQRFLDPDLFRAAAMPED